MSTMEETTTGGGRGSLILKSGIALAVGSAAFLVKYLVNRDAYDGMESIVSFSSRMIAGTNKMLFSYGGQGTQRFHELLLLLFYCVQLLEHWKMMRNLG